MSWHAAVRVGKIAAEANIFGDAWLAARRGVYAAHDDVRRRKPRVPLDLVHPPDGPGLHVLDAEPVYARHDALARGVLAPLVVDVRAHCCDYAHVSTDHYV